MIEPKEYDFCLRCGRRLKNPEARQRGYGIICYRKSKAVKDNYKFLWK